MIALFCLFLTLFASPFESKSRLAASRCCCTDADVWRVALKRCHGGAEQVALSCGSPQLGASTSLQCPPFFRRFNF
jgi:hypothetical protein